MANLTESDLQRALANHCLCELGHLFAAPNVHFLQGESDLVTVTRARYVHEFEIKLSRGDFQAEFREKREKHEMLRLGLDGQLPNYYWFVAPRGLLDVREVPSYAGLMEARIGRPPTNPVKLKIARPAPSLHTSIVTDADLIELGRKMMYKYWQFVAR